MKLLFGCAFTSGENRLVKKFEEENGEVKGMEFYKIAVFLVNRFGYKKKSTRQ